MTEANSNGKQLIPFGKYRGQPLEVLESDQQYLNWLTNQDWFRSGHPKLYSIVINNFAEPCDTPEHNQMQAMFLNQDFLHGFTDVVSKKRGNGILVKPVEGRFPKFEEKGVDVFLPVEIFLRKENGDHDNGHGISLAIEIKPSVGDDFPSVMRQMKKTESRYLFIRNYSGSGVSEEIFVQIFKSQEIDVIFEREVKIFPT